MSITAHKQVETHLTESARCKKRSHLRVPHPTSKQSHVMSKVQPEIALTITLVYEIPYIASFMFFFSSNFYYINIYLKPTRNDPLQGTLTQTRVQATRRCRGEGH